MSPAQAHAKLKKLLGPTAGYQFDPKAADAEERAKARALGIEAREQRDAAAAKRKARAEYLLANDAEYQQAKAQESAARIQCDELFGRARSYRITVGTSSSLFFHVKAQADTWAEIFEKLA